MLPLRTYARTALALLLGERCVVCGDVLAGAGVCPKCLLQLPYINIKGADGNPIERLFWVIAPIVRANALLSYRPANNAEAIIHAIKYHDRSDLAIEIGRHMAQEVIDTGFFDGIDYLQPIPLHPHRQRQRGYNQSERLARGISELTGIPIGNFVRRTTDNRSQTKLSHEERSDNVKGIFTPNAQELQSKQPKHVLFIDDVVTTGSTTISCIKAFLEGAKDQNSDTEAQQLQVSVMSLAYAGPLHIGRIFAEDTPYEDATVSNQEFRERQYATL